MGLELANFIFTVLTTAILMAIAIIEIFAVKRRQQYEDNERAADRAESRERQQFENNQTAFDLLAAVTTSEIIRLQRESQVGQSSDIDQEFLKAQYEAAISRQEALTTDAALDEGLNTTLANAIRKLAEAVDNPGAELLQRQAEANKTSGVQVLTDHSKYSWDGEGRLTKQDVLHRIGQRFIEREGITSRKDFDTKFGAVITGLLGPDVDGKPFSAARLLDELAPQGTRYFARDQALQTDVGAIEFDGKEYRVGWNLGYSAPKAIGVTVHKPVIEHFMAQPGYEIQPVS